MSYWLTELSTKSFLNVFRYITFRTGGAIVTARWFRILLAAIIDLLRRKQGKGQPIRSDGPQSHLVTKKGTPTMGGLMILSGLLVSTLLWANPKNPYVWVVLGVTLSFGMIGFYDDYLKIIQQTIPGFLAERLIIEAIIAVAACTAFAQLGRGRSPTSLVLLFQRARFQSRMGIHPAGCVRDCRRRQCSQSHRWSRWPRDCAGDDRFGELRFHFLSRGKRGVRGISADPLCRRHRRTGGTVRGGDRCQSWFSLVQRTASLDLHGRYRSLSLGGLLGGIAVACQADRACNCGYFVRASCFGHAQVSSHRAFGKVFKMAQFTTTTSVRLDGVANRSALDRAVVLALAGWRRS